MSALAAIIVLAAVAGGIAWLLAQSRHLERRRDLERRVLARKHGWVYDGQRDGRTEYRFSGSANGIDWRMWYDPDRGDDSPTPRAYWSSANLRTPDLALVIIGRRRYQLESGTAGRLLMGVVSGVAQAMTGQEPHSGKSEFYESAIEVHVGPDAFRQAFAVLVAPDMPTAWIDEELRSLLVDWPTGGRAPFSARDGLEVTLQAEGLRIVAQRMPQDAAFWTHLARLGESLARRLVPKA